MCYLIVAGLSSLLVLLVKVLFLLLLLIPRKLPKASSGGGGGFLLLFSSISIKKLIIAVADTYKPGAALTPVKIGSGGRWRGEGYHLSFFSPFK